MKISQSIRDEYGADLAVDADDAAAAEAGMRAKSEEFAAAGNRVYLPVVD
ncbi:hypothetical protein [Streptacidiphilus rugosus]|nr:hypothetical protein [Streptacidiphilus rugosus]